MQRMFKMIETKTITNKEGGEKKSFSFYLKSSN